MTLRGFVSPHPHLRLPTQWPSAALGWWLPSALLSAPLPPRVPSAIPGLKPRGSMYRSGDPGANVCGERSVKERLAADPEAPGLAAEAVQGLRVQADGNELSSLGTDRGPTDTAHRT